VKAAAMISLIFAAADPAAATVDPAAAAADTAATAADMNSTASAPGPQDIRDDLRHTTSFIVPMTIVCFIYLLAQRFFKYVDQQQQWPVALLFCVLC
jgi:hypothetical protein